MIRVSNVKIGLKTTACELQKAVEQLTGWKNIISVKTIKRSIDARNKKNIHFLYAFDILVSGSEEDAVRQSLYKDVSIETEEKNIAAGVYRSKSRPVVVGTGPAGMMAALALAEAGAKPIIIERGKPVSERQKDVELFWKTGKLDTDSNVQFGEGGAGTFSDGKLNTGIKKDAFTRKVLEEFIHAGAPEEIMYLAKPHVGTDKLAVVVKNLRQKIISLGGEYRFETKLTDLMTKDGILQAVRVQKSSGEFEEIDSETVILAVGHSARDTFEMLYGKGVTMLQKPFSVGARIEHPQTLINKSQYGFEKTDAVLGAADYKLAVHLPNGRSAYTFCMCPGGTVVAAASEAGRLVTNGMSEYARNRENANSALLVGILPADFHSEHPLGGMFFQRSLEEAAFKAGGAGYKAPAQCVGDFLENRASKETGRVLPSYTPGIELSDFRAILPSYVTETMKAALGEMDKKLHGFASRDALLTGPETRSSSPVRIVRDDISMQSVSVSGLYPCGEGAGYAGGIMSAAADGLKCAFRVIENS